jgi:hypothetical protein
MQMPFDVAEKFVKEMAKVEYPPAEYKERMEKSAAKLKAKKKKVSAQ